MSGAAVNKMAEVSPRELRLVVTAASLGTVFEWYDFFV